MSCWPFPRILAHRGGGTLAPENTLAAMKCGLQHGFRAVEFDVMLAHDGVPVVIHDHRLGRTVTGSAGIASLTSAALSAMDAGSWFGESYRGEPVPTFEQVFCFCRDNAIWMNIEIKPTPGTETQTGHVVATLVQQWTQQHRHQHQAKPPLLSSFSIDALVAAQAAAPAVPRGLLVDRLPADWVPQLQRIAAIALHANQKTMTKILVDQIKAAGYGLLCYTVNDVARAAELLGWGVDALCTDRLDLIDPHSYGDYFS